MGLWDWLKGKGNGAAPVVDRGGHYGARPVVERNAHYGARRGRGVRGGYDAADTNRHNENHWTDANATDAATVISPSLATLRNRSRYEIRNNGYARGMWATLADDTVGTGPILQIETGDPELNMAVEDRFAIWQDECDRGGRLCYADMLRLSVKQLVESGEKLGVFQSDPGAVARQVALRLLMIEPDRLYTPWASVYGSGVTDGIECDEQGRPVAYHIARKHPGNLLGSMLPLKDEMDRVPAEQVIHLYIVDRPGQIRGVPWLAPALPLCANLRRFTLAVIQAAETAANISGVITSPAGETAYEADAFDEVDIERNTLMTLPPGFEARGFDTKQPPSGYREFKGEIVNEMARPLGMPYNVAAGNSSGYNYASGRLDFQTYARAQQVLQWYLSKHDCQRVLIEWLREAIRIPGYLPDKSGRLKALLRHGLTQSVRMMAPNDHAFRLVSTNAEIGGVLRARWFWPGREHVDPQKEAIAQDVRLKNGTTTYADEYARSGKDWERQFEQIAREKKRMVEIGLTPSEIKADLLDSDTDQPKGDGDGGTQNE